VWGDAKGFIITAEYSNYHYFYIRKWVCLKTRIIPYGRTIWMFKIDIDHSRGGGYIPMVVKTHDCVCVCQNLVIIESWCWLKMWFDLKGQSG